MMHLKTVRQMRGRAQSGQAMIFLVMILIILVFVILWNFDLHKIIYTKYLSQNAGDSAAMGAARWQAISLNIIGDLNIMEAVAVTEQLSGSGHPAAARAINELQARLCYVGPMIGMMASQQAAKNNRIHNNDEFTAYLTEHVETILIDYPQFITEPYTNCLQEYAQMLWTICQDGIAAGPENMRLYTDYVGDHILLQRSFYEAVSTRAWCWFYFNAGGLLNSYQDYQDWPPLPPIGNPVPVNAEFFSLHLQKMALFPGSELVDAMNQLKQNRALGGSSMDYTLLRDEAVTFYCYDASWFASFAMSDDSFPADGEVREQYDYAGADSAIRIVANDLDLRTPGSRIDKVTWTAAAKPFGYLNVNDNPVSFNVVLPAFRDVRLIPVDASSASSSGSFDLTWRKHCEDHLRDYVTAGQIGLRKNCSYCSQIRSWDRASFRNQAVDWLRDNSALCTIRTSGGSGPGGGSRVGH